MSLKAIYMSDICNGNGMEIEQRYWEGNWMGLSLQYQWTSTTNPITTEWHVWQQGLTKGLALGCNRRLALPLGKWWPHMKEQDGYFLN